MFDYYQPTKIHFGKGRLNEIGEVVKRYGNRCILVTTPNEAPLDKLFERVINILKQSKIEVIQFEKVLPNPTVEIVEEGFKLAKEFEAEVVLGVGGGSSIDTAKMIALTYGLDSIDWDELFSNYDNPFAAHLPVSDKSLPLIAVSTTSGTGSQVTQAAVISRGIDKNTIFHPDNYAKECVVDPELMTTLPPRITASTGFDAFCHAFESYINVRASTMTEIKSIEAMRLVVENLPEAVKDGNNLAYREPLAIADTLAGISLSNAGAAAPHPLGEIIGGVTNIPHGETLAIVFPAYTEEAWENNITKFAKVARIFNSSLEKEEDKVAAKALSEEIKKFLKEINLNKSLKDYNITDEQFKEILDCPVLEFLPFGSKEDLQEIIKKSY